MSHQTIHRWFAVGKLVIAHEARAHLVCLDTTQTRKKMSRAHIIIYCLAALKVYNVPHSSSTEIIDFAVYRDSLTTFQLFGTNTSVPRSFGWVVSSTGWNVASVGGAAFTDHTREMRSIMGRARAGYDDINSV